MKKILFVMITIFLLPIFVYADDNNLVLKSITLEKLSEDVEELSPARIENNKINLDLKMYEVGDTAEYIVTVENISDKDLYIEKNLINAGSNYFDYELLGSDKSTIIEKNSEKEFILKVKYQNEVEKENFYSAKYSDKFSLAFRFTSGVNPETKRNLLLILVLFICLFIAFKYNRKSKVFLLLLVVGLIPFITQAEDDYTMEINSNIMIKMVKPNPCTFDGELVQGAEYTNGQYTYRYMQEGNVGNRWENMENVGWGVALTDKDSEEDVTTKLCTYINDKPIVSMHYMFVDSKTKNIDLSSFDTSNVVNMDGMFDYVKTLENLDLSNFDTSNVTSMDFMFYHTGENTTTFNLNVSKLDTSKVSSMRSMFLYAGYNATEWNIEGLPDWDTSNVVNMSSMFSSAGRNAMTFNLDLSNWKVSNVVNMSGMFTSTGYSATDWSIGDLSNWDTSNVTDMGSMFSSAGFNATTWSIGDLSNWDTSNVTNMRSMFSNAGYNAATWNSIGTLKVYSTNIIDMFRKNPKVKVILDIYINPTSYSATFYGAATAADSLITVNYKNDVTNIDNIIATKSSDSNVVKGSIIS